MGLLNYEIINFLKIAKSNGIEGTSLIMIGKQDINVDINNFLNMLDSFGLFYNKELAKKISDDEHIDAYDFFSMLGFTKVDAMDYSDFEGANICWDLNEKIPTQLMEKYDYVINGGTMEHVYNVAQAMENIMGLVKKDGYVVHISPVSGWVDHGFFSFSPTFFQDYCSINGFEIETIEFEGIYDYENGLPKSIISEDLRFFTSGKSMNVFINGLSQFDKTIKTLLFVIARKKTSSKNDVPMQGFYQNVHKKGNIHVLVETISFRKWANEINETNERICLYGSGDVCNRLLNEIYRLGAEDRVEKIFDSDVRKAGMYVRGKIVEYPLKDRLINCSSIHICNATSENEIVDYLKAVGVDIHKIRRTSEFVNAR